MPPRLPACPLVWHIHSASSILYIMLLSTRCAMRLHNIYIKHAKQYHRHLAKDHPNPRKQQTKHFSAADHGNCNRAIFQDSNRGIHQEVYFG